MGNLRGDPNSTPIEHRRRRSRWVAPTSRGDTVSFEGHYLIQRVGSIVRVNQKTATVSCDDLYTH